MRLGSARQGKDRLGTVRLGVAWRGTEQINAANPMIAEIPGTEALTLPRWDNARHGGGPPGRRRDQPELLSCRPLGIKG